MFKRIVAIICLLIALEISSNSSFILINGYEKALDIYQSGWKMETKDSIKGYNFVISMLNINQFTKGKKLFIYQTILNTAKDIDLNENNFFKFELRLKNENNFDPLLTNSKITVRENFYHLFNIRNYLKFQIFQQYGDFLNSNVIDYYRIGIFSKMIRRQCITDSFYLGFQTIFTFLPHWKIEETKKRHDILSSLMMSFSRYIGKTMNFNIKYQVLYNYSSAKVSQVDIKYFYVETPDQTSVRELAADFYNYYLHLFSGEFLKSFSKKIYTKFSFSLEDKEYTERKAYDKLGNQKSELEKDFNISISLFFIGKNIPFNRLNLILELKYENKSSNNKYEGYFYYNIEKYSANLNLIYNF
jgi:hypothetical protein